MRELRVACTVADAAAVAEALTALGWGNQWTEEPLAQHTDDDGYVLDEPAPDAPAVVHAYPSGPGGEPDVPMTVLGFATQIIEVSAAVEATDWETAWRSAHPDAVAIDEQWVLVPPWSSRRGEPHALVVEPGGAFGTGTHPTTRDSLALLRRYLREGDRVADLGAGSGVLAVAAARWGAGAVVAVDTQADVPAQIAANAVLNGLDAARIEVVVADLAAWGAATRGTPCWDLVLCNVGALELLRALPVVRERLARGGVAIGSGVFAPSRERVEAAAIALGFVPLEARSEDDWCTFAWRAAAARS